MNIKHRQCFTCKKVKPLSEYYSNKTCPDGRIRNCKKCKLAYDKVRAMTWGREKRLAVQKRFRNKRKQELFDAYGNKCACCGDTHKEFLTIDHIHGGGKKHREAVGFNLVPVIRKEGYPKDKYRLLCYNCNFSIGFHGYCPHQA